MALGRGPSGSFSRMRGSGGRTRCGCPWKPAFAGMTTTPSRCESAPGGAPVFEYDFMRMAFAAAGAAALLSGAVGYFLVLRGQSFAGHALSHVGFTGATGAALFGLSPLAGLVAFSALAGFVMGLIGEKWSERDVAIGMTLSLALGLGLLFLHFYTAAATQATALLFGNVLGVDDAALWTLVALAVGSLAALG